MNTSGYYKDNMIYRRIFEGGGERKRLAGDASTRLYFRVSLDGKSFILCDDHVYAEYTGEDYPFIVTQNLLDGAGIPVPAIHATDKKRGLFILQDLGDDLLEQYIKGRSEGELVKIYRPCLDLLTDLQSIRGKGTVPFGLSFDREKLMFEFSFFIEHTLEGYFNLDLSRGGREELLRAFEEIVRILVRPELFVLNHRDYHARNIMVHRGGLYLIDFQDARMGLPHYDLVSLLCDPYAALPGTVIEALTVYYYELAGERGLHDMGEDEFRYYFDIMAYQRLVKAAGSYGYLVREKKKMEFEKYIVPTLNAAAMYAEGRRELAPAGDILGSLLEGAGEGSPE